jgi:hypothetical protein
MARTAKRLAQTRFAVNASPARLNFAPDELRQEPYVFDGRRYHESERMPGGHARTINGTHPDF